MGGFSSGFCHQNSPVDRVSDFGVKPRCGSPPDDWSRFQKSLKFSLCRYQQAIFLQRNWGKYWKNRSQISLLGMVAVVQHKPEFRRNGTSGFPKHLQFSPLVPSNFIQGGMYSYDIKNWDLGGVSELIGYSCIFRD